MSNIYDASLNATPLSDQVSSGAPPVIPCRVTADGTELKFWCVHCRDWHFADANDDWHEEEPICCDTDEGRAAYPDGYNLKAVDSETFCRWMDEHGPPDTEYGLPTREEILTDNIRKGRKLHASLLELADVWITEQGKSPYDVICALLGMMEKSRAKATRPRYWQALYDNLAEVIGKTYSEVLDKDIAEFAAGLGYEVVDKVGGELAVTFDDFRAYMPAHTYVYLPTREHWPASSVDARLDKVGRIKASTWLDQNRSVVQMVWAPGSPMLIEGRVVAEGGWIDKPGATILNLYRPSTATATRGRPGRG
jgi:hypothetical protein